MSVRPLLGGMFFLLRGIIRDIFWLNLYHFAITPDNDGLFLPLVLRKSGLNTRLEGF